MLLFNNLDNQRQTFLGIIFVTADFPQQTVCGAENRGISAADYPRPRTFADFPLSTCLYF